MSASMNTRRSHHRPRRMTRTYSQAPEPGQQQTERHLRIWSRVISRDRRWVSGSGEGRTQTNWVAARRTDWGEGATRHDQSGVVPISCSPAPGTLVGLVA
ncbi:hypothetical protein BHM03_00035451 [Ensete ventricosum]|nr:hypothetical protein BHM03_00035451 [Ensete ventricosum]